MNSNKTRERVLDASLKLFNEKKASNVSTVQISASMKMSPGNLYYYYANKEEVIRCILNERMLGELNDLIDSCGKAEDAESLLSFLRSVVNHCLKFKFFYVEMPTLFVNDNSLIEINAEIIDKVKTAVRSLYGKWTADGRACEEYAEGIDMITDNALAVLKGAIAECDAAAIGGAKKDAQINIALTRLTAYLMPLFTEKMKEEISSLS